MADSFQRSILQQDNSLYGLQLSCSLYLNIHIYIIYIENLVSNIFCIHFLSTTNDKFINFLNDGKEDDKCSVKYLKAVFSESSSKVGYYNQAFEVLYITFIIFGSIEKVDEFVIRTTKKVNAENIRNEIFNVNYVNVDIQINRARKLQTIKRIVLLQYGSLKTVSHNL